ncbi:site-specific DNA-methyltransferase [Clostridium perfringens]|uniref:site-specific DNA-methyltransferase n=1 Tax=Clostridium perfringens TaxID=1502 RepID=UPI00285C279F|nr:site-specific DNA-methyltransferase [Clostridium perfringens]MDK0898714.1 site-specific DNA-methyltransferase [Clostridium perfringens]MDK0904174.1 site-specific DNA-methyltransferase [Clostridium perfringens]MDM0902453.1 site-specific DNA-methyltransferase [Clostridium perfringens]MDM0972809.1 site-specific DNA-methyltransferase [Clostridium perfringens]
MDREKYKLDGKSFNIIEDNIKKLQELFPEIVTEGKVDIDKLALLFDKARNEDTEGKLDGEERYEFTWKGKKEAMRLAQKQSTGTLRPCREESVNFDETQNLYIEGDNLEVLRALQSSYRGKVKMIYIDPPYNTGNDFIYKDDFKDNIANYKEKMNEACKTNTNNDGRYHTNWLNMMYPRLKLARNLLTEDGVIFISIDDNEVANLKKICDEILGEYYYIGQFVKQSKVGGGSDSKYMAKEHEYLLVYAKNIDYLPEMFEEHNKEYLKRYKETDDNGKFYWDTFARNGLKNPINYDIVAPDGTIINGNWIRSKERFEKEYKNGIIRIIKKNDGNWSVQFKQYLNINGKKPRSMTTDFGGTIDGKREIENLFDNDKVFSYPKSTSFLIKLMRFIAFKEDEIVLDFFSGSATTAHAVMKLNAEDNGKRRFIMVQIPEETDEKSEAFKAGYRNICEIGKERIRRAGKKILEENEGKEGIEDLEIGFKVFKLDSTNLKEWDENILSNKENKQQSFDDLKNPIKEGRTTEDLVYEIMLKYGVDLTMQIEELEILGSKVYSVGCGYLMICLEDNISLDLIEAIGNEKPNRVVLADKGLTTSDLINGEKILTELGVQDIRTI